MYSQVVVAQCVLHVCEHRLRVNRFQLDQLIRYSKCLNNCPRRQLRTIKFLWPLYICTSFLKQTTEMLKTVAVIQSEKEDEEKLW